MENFLTPTKKDVSKQKSINLTKSSMFQRSATMSYTSQEQSSKNDLSHSAKISRTKITILENIEEFTNNYTDNNISNPFNKEYFEQLKNDDITLNDFLDYFYNYIKVVFDKTCKNSFSALAENEKLQTQIPVDDFENKLEKVVRFYKIYQNVNKKLISSVADNSKINKELTSIVNNIHEEKNKIDDLLKKVVQRLKDANAIFQNIYDNFSIVITVEIQNLIQNSKTEKEKLINYINRFLQETNAVNNNVYNEEEYIKFIDYLENKISQIQNHDKLIDESIESLLRNKENEHILLKDELERLKNAELFDKMDVNRKLFVSPNKDNNILVDDNRRNRDLDKEKDILESKLKENQEKLKKLIREKNIFENNLEEKYSLELQRKYKITYLLISILIFLFVVFIVQHYFYI